MSKPPARLQPEEQDLHRIFTSLRDYTLEVMDDFTSRVMDHISQAGPHRERSPSLVEIMRGSLLEALNLLAGVMGFHQADSTSSDEDDDHAE